MLAACIEKYLRETAGRAPDVLVDQSTGLPRMPRTPAELDAFLECLDVPVRGTRLYPREEYDARLREWRCTRVRIPELPHTVDLRNIVHRLSVSRVGADGADPEQETRDAVLLTAEALMIRHLAPDVEMADDDDDANVNAIADVADVDEDIYGTPMGAEPTAPTERGRTPFASVTQLRHALYPLVPQTQTRKFASVTLQFAPPLSNSVTLQASGHVECKGSSSYLATYLTLECVLAALARAMPNTPIHFHDEGVKNIVATCAFSGVILTDVMCTDRTAEARDSSMMATTTATAEFPGVMWMLSDHTIGEQPFKFRVFPNKSEVILVAARTPEQAARAFLQFYKVAMARKAIADATEETTARVARPGDDEDILDVGVPDVVMTEGW